MYEDSWYSFVPDTPSKKEDAKGHKRKESLLGQPIDTENSTQREVLASLYEETPINAGPPEATLARRAKSWGDFYHVARAHVTKDCQTLREKEQDTRRKQRGREARKYEIAYDDFEDALLESSQEEFWMYQAQLALSERHLDGLLNDTNAALETLAGLSSAFKAVESQTTAFRAQCEDLLAEQQRLKTLGEEVGDGLQYYSYLEPITRRLNAPGASRVIGDDSFVEMLSRLDTCIDFMIAHPKHREAETYLTRYRSLYARTLNLIQIKFSSSLKTRQAESRKIFDSEPFSMTNVFLAQLPNSTAKGGELIETMVYLFGEDPMPQTPRQELPTKNVEQIQIRRRQAMSIMNEWIQVRTELMDHILKSHAAVPIDSDNISSWSHTQIEEIVEIVGNEYIAFSTDFNFATALSDTRGLAEQYASSLEHGPFMNYAHSLCAKALVRLEGRMAQLDLPTSIAIITWSESHFKDHSADMNDMSEASAPLEESPRQGESIMKSKLADFIKKRLTTPIFSRMKHVLLQSVERFTPTPADLTTNPATTSTDKSEDVTNLDPSHPIINDADARAYAALGPGFLTAYKPLKTAVTLLVFFIDLTFDQKYNPNDEQVKDELAYEIMHSALNAIVRASEQVSRKTNAIDGYLFAIKNLVLLKNIVQAYEISGNRQAAALDFTRMWTTFADLRERGGLLDLTAYYRLLRNGDLFPQVITNVDDAQVELDGQLRTTITNYRKECATKVYKARGKNEATVQRQLIEQLRSVFKDEEQLRDNLWAAVGESLEEMKYEKR